MTQQVNPDDDPSSSPKTHMLEQADFSKLFSDLLCTGLHAYMHKINGCDLTFKVRSLGLRNKHRWQSATLMYRKLRVPSVKTTEKKGGW